jgi:transposase
MQYCGLDLGKKSSVFCIVEQDRRLVREGKVSNRAAKLREVFGAFPPMRIVLEASGKAFWVADQLRALGHEPIVVDPGRTKAIGSSLIKNDRLDARILATLCAADLLARVDQPTPEQRLARMPAVARDCLVRARIRLMLVVRSLCDSEGIDLPSGTAARFHLRVDALLPQLPEPLALAIAPVLHALAALTEQIEHCDEQLAEAVTRDPVAQLLMTTPGVGPVVAFAFVQALRDPARFASGRAVGAYLGLVPSLYQSGNTHRRGRITKRGNRAARCALTQAANVLLHPRLKQASALRSWGLALVEKKGRKTAVVAVARKLAAVLWAMWCEGKPFEPRLREQHN